VGSNREVMGRWPGTNRVGQARLRQIFARVRLLRFIRLLCTSGHGVLDTSLPNQLSTSPHSLVYPNRQRSDNGAKKYVHHQQQRNQALSNKDSRPLIFDRTGENPHI
jgi:hypothetical protein